MVADAMSRIKVAAVQELLSLENLAKAQSEDEEVLLQKQGFRDQAIKNDFPNHNCTVLCSLFNSVERPIVPKAFRYKIFQQLHGISHPGAEKTFKLISRSYYWPCMKIDIRKWCRCCPDCQKSKITRHTKSEFGRFPESDRFEHVHMDLITVLEVDGYSDVVTFIDRRTRWIEAIPVKETTASAIAQAFVEVWISRYGVPSKLSSDRGPQFRSDLFDEFGRLLRVEAIRTTAYNPKANGLLERVHRT